MKTRLLVLLILIVSSGCSVAEEIDKFSLWENPSYFRGAAVHPYVPYGEEDGRIYTTEEDFIVLREQGANVVSLNYPGPFTVESPYRLDPEALQYLDNAIDWAEEAGLYVIIHFRNGPGKSEETFYGEDGRADETIWYNKKEQRKWIQMWRFVAKRYRDRTNVIGYNLMVEPHPEDTVNQEPLSARVWNRLAKRITSAIREVDPDTPIIVSATIWANPIAFSDLKPTGDSRTIYSFHMYEPFEYTHQGFEWAGMGGDLKYEYPGFIPSGFFEEIRYWDREVIEEVLQPVIDFQERYGVPIFVGEFGANRRIPSCINFLSDLLGIFEAHGWSYTYFLWRDTDDFDYEKEYDGDERVPESSYMCLFKEYWSNNEYVDSPHDLSPLKTLAEQCGISFGAFYQYDIRSDIYDQVFETEINVMTVGTFWTDGFREGRTQFDFSEMDAKVNWGLTHDMELYGQTLVWFDDIPDWLKMTPDSEVEAIMNEHIDTVVGRYAGRIKAWNVVNEAVDEDGTLRQNHKWAEAMGNDYIAKAFIRAHAADPTAVLYYNEYDIESNGAKFEGVKALLISLKNQGVPVHALGWQLHVRPSSFDPDVLLARMNEIADIGFDNYITELDVELPADVSEADYEQQKQTYKTIVEIFMAAHSHKTIVVWGLRDGDPYWLTDGHPLLFDENLEKKPAYYGVQEALLICQPSPQ